MLRLHYPRTIVYPAVLALVLANTLNAGADIGAIAAAINLLVPIPAIVFIIPVSVGILAVQVFGSYRLIANVFKWLALALLAYIAAALFARPHLLDVLRGTPATATRPPRPIDQKDLLSVGRSTRCRRVRESLERG